ncbi:hypothetical protein N2W52_001940 [Clostridium perfringens]|nr:hypothetical protein [Clostridium perfringens]MDK0982954.1 hypothetical protein [Clostridium perfringens]
MKQLTLMKLRSDLLKDFKSRWKLFNKRRKEGYTYSIEHLPVMVERNASGNIEEIMFPSTNIIYKTENKENL